MNPEEHWQQTGKRNIRKESLHLSSLHTKTHIFGTYTNKLCRMSAKKKKEPQWGLILQKPTEGHAKSWAKCEPKFWVKRGNFNAKQTKNTAASQTTNEFSGFPRYPQIHTKFGQEQAPILGENGRGWTETPPCQRRRGVKIATDLARRPPLPPPPPLSGDGFLSSNSTLLDFFFFFAVCFSTPRFDASFRLFWGNFISFRSLWFSFLSATYSAPPTSDLLVNPCSLSLSL